MDLKDKKIAIVCDWIKDMWGAELVLKHMLEAFPNADIYTSVFWQQDNPIFKWRKIVTSFIQKIPFLNKSHKLALVLRPLAFESFDLSEYDIVISSSSAESKWVITKPSCLHICYCHTPTRYFWSHFHEYINMMEFWILNPLWKWLMPKIVHKLRQWDYCAAQRPDFFIANSENTKKRIEKYYKRDSEVIYPWIDSDRFIFNDKKKDFYLYVWRCIPYKKFDLIVDAFNENWRKLILVTNTDNKLYRELKNKSKENIAWKLNINGKSGDNYISSEEKNKLYSEAKAFLFPPEEDFGLVPVEAMISETPVIAYGKWGALETVIPPSDFPFNKGRKQAPTWVFFEEQTCESLNEAIKKFENQEFDPQIIRDWALGFDKSVFKGKILMFIEGILKN